MHRRFLDYLVITLKGIAMGAADVVPGVSGGTIAFISGIYEELIESIDKINLGVFKVWKQEGFKTAWKSINGNFLLALFSGIAISILSLAKLIKWLLHNEPVLLWSFFFGLVLASILYIAKQIKGWSAKIIIAIIVTSILSYFITLAEPFASPDSPFYLLFCGFIAIIAMILPGVSGAFILLILGAYQTAIDTINNLLEGLTTGNMDLFKDAFLKFCLLAIGAVVGLKVFSKALNWMFKHHKNLTLAILTGFMIGSLNKIWPWKEILKTRIDSHGEEVTLLDKSILPTSYDGNNQLVLALIFIIIGFGTILILEHLGKQKNKA
ncbi:integral membrane protein [Flavobacteriales bacterium ALC-1]|nr:integral membrane protein [Flavobacteriales bacterium ALC-1]